MKTCYLFLFAVLLLSGCGSSTDFDTIGTSAPAGGNAPTAVSRRIQAAYADGSGHLALSLQQTGTTVEGTALVRPGPVGGTAQTASGLALLFATARGSLHDDQLTVRLTTDSRDAAPRTFELSGQLGGTGQLSEPSTGSNTSLTLAEQSGSGGLVQFEITLPGWYDIICQQTGDFSGDFTCVNNSLPVNDNYSGKFTLTVDYDTGEAVIDLNQGDGRIHFQLVSPGTNTPWIGDSYIQRDDEQLFEGGGFVEIED